MLDGNQFKEDSLFLEICNTLVAQRDWRECHLDGQPVLNNQNWKKGDAPTEHFFLGRRLSSIFARLYNDAVMWANAEKPAFKIDPSDKTMDWQDRPKAFEKLAANDDIAILCRCPKTRRLIILATQFDGGYPVPGTGLGDKRSRMDYIYQDYLMRMERKFANEMMLELLYDDAFRMSVEEVDEDLLYALIDWRNIDVKAGKISFFDMNLVEKQDMIKNMLRYHDDLQRDQRNAALLYEIQDSEEYERLLSVSEQKAFSWIDDIIHCESYVAPQFSMLLGLKPQMSVIPKRYINGNGSQSIQPGAGPSF